MGPYTWQYTWCQNCFWWIDVMKGTLGQQRNYFFTLSQGLGVSCLQFCKQPSSCILMLLCHLGWQKEVSPEGRGTPLLEETGFTLVQVPILSPGLNSLSVYAFHCWLLKWQESIEFPANMCSALCQKGQPLSATPALLPVLHEDRKSHAHLTHIAYRPITTGLYRYLSNS